MESFIPVQDRATNRTPIEHVVVIMKENHAFDNYFGTYPGADGISGNMTVPDGQGGFIAPHPLNATWTWDLPHSREAMLQSYDGGKNDGFAMAANAAFPGLGEVAMGYYDRRQARGYGSLAENYTLADRSLDSCLMARRGASARWPHWTPSRTWASADTLPEMLRAEPRGRSRPFARFRPPQRGVRQRFSSRGMSQGASTITSLPPKSMNGGTDSESR